MTTTVLNSKTSSILLTHCLVQQTPTSYADGAGRQNNSAARNSSFGDYDASALDKDQSDDSGPNQGNSAGGPKRKRPSRYKNVSEDVLNVSGFAPSPEMRHVQPFS